MFTEDRLFRGSNSSLSSCSSVTSEQRASFFIGQEIAEDSEMAPSSSFTRYDIHRQILNIKNNNVIS